MSHGTRASLLAVGLAAALLTGCPPPETCLDCHAFSLAGNFSDPRIVECSGLVASQANPGVLWTHNDSGDAARLFAVQEDGELRGVYTLDGVAAVDWEDVAWGPCDALGWADCLYVGDIGDNGRSRAEIQIYRVAEPIVPPAGSPVEEVLGGVERFRCAYPDGPHDAEVLLVDPEAGLPYVVTKEDLGATAVYRFPAAPVPDVLVTLEKVADLADQSFLTGGDVSPDLSRVILRGYILAVEYPRPAGGAFEDAFAGTPCAIPLAVEVQGEALAVGPSGEEIFTASEGLSAPIHRATCTLP